MRRRFWSTRRRRIGVAVAGLGVAVLAIGLLVILGPGPRARSGAETLVQIPRGSGVSGVAAALEAARRLELHKQRRDFFDVVVPDEVLAGTAPKLMDLVRLRHRRFNLSAGRLFRLLGIRPALAKGQTTLTLWG